MLVQQEDVYSNFVNSIKSDVTRRIYEYNLRLFMEFCGINKFQDLISDNRELAEIICQNLLNGNATINMSPGIPEVPVTSNHTLN